MTSTEATVKRSKRLSPIWIIPILALSIGVWIVFKTFQEQGPTVTIEFESASGLEAEKTKIKFRSVDVGVVESVRLSKTYDKVIIRARIDRSARDLLTQDADVWVVKPRVGIQGISGISTLLSGNYIAISPGIEAPGKRFFVGLEDPPLTPADTPGTRVTLISSDGNSLSAGDPVLYRNHTVGKVERANFNINERLFEYMLFIEAPYNDLLTSTSRFWNVSGISISTSSEGISLEAGTLESILMGGVTFGIPEKMGTGFPVEDGEEFNLYPDYDAINEMPYLHSSEYVLLFHSSIRGLAVGAPVQYRGIDMGNVVGISFDYVPDPQETTIGDVPIPVKIRIDPARMGFPDTQDSLAELHSRMENRVGEGLRATLSTGNIITGELYVSLDFFPNEDAATIDKLGDYYIFPTVSSGFSQIQKQITNILNTVESLPIEETVVSANAAIAELEKALVAAQETMNSVTQFIGKEETQGLPAEINQTLEELRKTVESFSSDSDFQRTTIDTLKEIEEVADGIESMLKTLKAKPTALIFSGNQEEDPIPGKKRND